MIEFLEDTGYDMLVSPLHDKDDTKPHYHVILNNKGGKQRKTIVKEFAEFGVTYCIALVAPGKAKEYLTHSNERAKEEGKHEYDINSVTVINNGICIDMDDSRNISDFKALIQKSDELGCYHFNDFVYSVIADGMDELCNKLIHLSPVQVTIMKEYMSSIKREYKLREREKHEENMGNSNSDNMHNTRNESDKK